MKIRHLLLCGIGTSALIMSGCAGMTRTEKGATIGAVAGGSAGALLAGIPTFGLAAWIGGVAGAAGGGALGAAIAAETVPKSQFPDVLHTPSGEFHGQQHGSYDAQGVYHGVYRGSYDK